MQLAKYHLDVGLFTNRPEAMLAFWREQVGLPFEESVGTEDGVQQHRHGMNGSVLTLNAVNGQLPAETPSGYRELLIARAGLPEFRRLVDPDGNVVTLVPEDEGWLEGIAVRLAVRSEAAFHDFYGRVLELEAVGSNAYRCGDTVLLFDEEPEVVSVGEEMRGRGYRYLTIEVWDVDAEHAAALGRGAREGQPPQMLGSSARNSFLRDPDGNWIELFQRASLTGPLPG